MQGACARLSYVACPALLYFSTLSHKRQIKRKLLNTICVIRFSLQLLSETFLILRRNERDVIKMYIGLHVKYLLFFFNFNENLIFLTVFRKILKYQMS
jgi:hypothetical protein